MPRLRIPWRTVALVLGAIASMSLSLPVTAQESEPKKPEPSRQGVGWSITEVNAEVRLRPAEGVMAVVGDLELRLTGLDESYGPTLLTSTFRLPTGEPAMAFRMVESSGATSEILEEPLAGRWQQAALRFEKPKGRGSAIQMRFESETQGTVGRMIVHDSAAMADWLNAWLPFTLSDPGGRFAFSPNLFRAPGRTTLHLPAGWRGLVDGELVERLETENETTEIWQTPEGIARGFVAGPYEIVERTVDGRQIQVYLLDDTKTPWAERIAQRLGQAIAAQESKLGPLPIPGAYTIVEFPRLPQQTFGAVSEQTHIIVQAPNLDYAHGNIQLFAHEVSHAWWGNRIGTAGPGLKWVNESLAQLGALIAIESLEGQTALHEFLDFGRVGTDPYYCAAGYFTLLRQGQDQPIAEMGTGAGTHAIANSKGVWVLHMLRVMIGDDLFYSVLRSVIRELDGSDLTVENLRDRFVQAAPDEGLEQFFSQWLDRTGAPVFDVDWHANIEGDGLLLQLSQLEAGEPFKLALDVEIELADGSNELARVEVVDALQIFEIETHGRPVAVRLDPGHKLLMWRPEYGPRPVNELLGDSMFVPEELVDAVVGEYRFEVIDKNVEIFERDGQLFIRPAGSVPVRLIHDHDGVFRVDAPGKMIVDLDLSRERAPSFVSIEGGGRERYVAKRVITQDSDGHR